MSDATKSDLDSGTVNSDRVERDVTRDQQLERQRQDAEDAGMLRIDTDAGDGDGSAGEGSTGAADPGQSIAN